MTLIHKFAIRLGIPGSGVARTEAMVWARTTRPSGLF